MSSRVKGGVSVQGELKFPNDWGGRRKGAGRKPIGGKAQVPHARRQTFRGRRPVHITIPLVKEFGGLKRKAVFEIVRRALLRQSQFANVRPHPPYRTGDALVQEFVVLNDHVHVLVDAADADAVSRAVKSWGGRVAWAMRAKAAQRAEQASSHQALLLHDNPHKVFRHRYHARVLNTPSEVKLARDYIRANYRRHMAKVAARTGQRPPWFRGGWFDECSTADATLRALLPPPKCWLIGDEAARLAEGAIDLLARQRDKRRWLGGGRTVR